MHVGLIIFLLLKKFPRLLPHFTTRPCQQTGIVKNLNTRLTWQEILNGDIIWYNPPYSMNVETNIAKKFLQLVSKHFWKGHKLSKVFNRNNVKFSYSCMPNVASIISTRNNKVPNNNDNSIRVITPGCNCRNRNECSLRGNCLDKSVVYCGKVTIKEENGKNYIGVTENTRKDRNYKHRNS